MGEKRFGGKTIGALFEQITRGKEGEEGERKGEKESFCAESG